MDARKGWPARETLLALSALVTALLLGGCQVVVGSVANNFAADLSSTILNSDDPELVRDAAPAYLLLVDSLLSPESSPELLGQAASLNGAYAAAFVTDEERAQKFADKALKYAQQAVCAEYKPACTARTMEFADFEAWVSELGLKDVPMVYAYATSWAGWIQANASDWAAIAELQRVKTLMARVAELDEGYDNAGPRLYLGVFETLLPPMMGGKPEVGRAHFERALELSEHRHLLAKVYYAQSYARLVFDRELHDRLLTEVLSADVNAPDLTLTNTIAQQQAKDLLDTADDYF